MIDEEFRYREIQGHRVGYVWYPSIAATGIAEGVFTSRIGGVSPEPYASLNLGKGNDDAKENIDANYRIAAAILCTVPERCVLGYQTHTANVRAVTEEDAGKGTVRERDYRDVDGLVTNVQDLTLVTLHADCTPLYFVDPVHRAIGMAHSGWRGTVKRIGRNILETMQSEYGTCPDDVIAVIGPTIRGCCYEIGPEVAEQFIYEFGDRSVREEKILTPGKGDRSMLDMAAANRRVLLDAGIRSDHLTVTAYCTCCRSDLFYSHRAAKGQKRGNGAGMLRITAKK